MTTFSSSSSLRRTRNAFTLIELLVVIAIIGLLAAILFPVFARARENARRTVCLSNIKQIGTAIQQYAQDYDEKLPGAWGGPAGENQYGGWVRYTAVGNYGAGDKPAFDLQNASVQPYMKSSQIFMCPSDKHREDGRTSYAMNACALDKSDNPSFGRGRSLASFEESTQWMLLSEEGTKNMLGDDFGVYYDGLLNLESDSSAAIEAISPNHFDGATVTFVDGHAKWYLLTRISTQRFRTGGSAEDSWADACHSLPGLGPSS